MSETKADGRFSPVVETRMLFPNIKEAKAVMKNGKPRGEPKFSGRFVVKNAADIAAIRQKVKEIAQAKWPGVDGTTLKLCYTAGEKEAEKSKANGKDGSIFPAGSLIVTARSKYQPVLSIWQGRTTPPQELEGPALSAHIGKFYNGCIVLPQFTFVAYDAIDADSKPGVNAYLDKVMWVKDGQRVGGQSSAEAFKHYQGSTTDEDPTAGAKYDDEIPF